MQTHKDEDTKRPSLEPGKSNNSTSTMSTMSTSYASRSAPLPPNFVSNERKQQLEDVQNEKIRRKIESQNNGRRKSAARPSLRSAPRPASHPKRITQLDDDHNNRVKNKISRVEHVRGPAPRSPLSAPRAPVHEDIDGNSAVNRKLKDFTYVTDEGSIETGLGEGTRVTNQGSLIIPQIKSLRTVSTEDSNGSHRSIISRPRGFPKPQNGVEEEVHVMAVEAYVVDPTIPYAIAKEQKTGWHKYKSHMIIGFLAFVGVVVGLLFGINMNKEKPPPSTSTVSKEFFQIYRGKDLTTMNKAQVETFENNFVGYTENFGVSEGVDTVCNLHDQTILDSRKLRALSAQKLRVDFTMIYASSKVNVAEYPKLFQDFMNSKNGLAMAIMDLQSVGVPVESSDILYLDSEPTPAPTTHTPTIFPTPSPSFSPLLQLGNNFISPEHQTETWYGDSVSLSSGCTRIAIGAPKYDTSNLTENGLVQIYDLNGDERTKVAEVAGKNNQDWYGRSVSLTANGKFLAVGAPQHVLNGVEKVGLVEVYQISEGAMTKRGQTLYGEGESSKFGGHVSLSDDGNRLAVASFLYAQVFEFNESTKQWDKLGTIGGREGYSRVSVSRDGKYFAVSFRFDSVESEQDGLVQIFEYKSQSFAFIQVGQNLVGYGKDHKFGADISMSYDGKRVAIGSEGGGGNYVRVFELDEEAKRWVQLHVDIEGNEGDNKIFGYRVSLSADGSRLAIGSPFYDGDFETMGRVVIYELNQLGRWVQFGNDIKGLGNYVQAGKAVSISPDGRCVAVGTPVMDNEGIVSVFEL